MSSFKKDFTNENTLTIESSIVSKVIGKVAGFANLSSWLDEKGNAAFIEENRNRGEQVLPDVKTISKLTRKEADGKNYYILGDDSAKSNVLYIHGGAYVMEITEFHVKFCDRLARELDAKVYIPLYPLAPDEDYRDAFPFMEKVYEEIAEQNKKFYIMGDSAGGGFTLAFTQTLRDAGRIMPDKIVLISPWLDVTMSNPESEKYNDSDLLLDNYGLRKCGELWAGDLDPKDPRISPLFGEMRGLPPALSFVGTAEVMYPDVTELHRKMKEAGVCSKLVYGNGMWHIFSVFDLPEGKESMKIIKEFVNEK